MEVCGVNIDLNKQNGYFINADCMDGMKEFPDKYFDLAIVDPPYGLPRDSSNGGGKLKNRAFNRGNISRWDIAPPKEYFIDLMRVSKQQVIWGGNYYDLPKGGSAGENPLRSVKTSEPKTRTIKCKYYLPCGKCDKTGDMCNAT